MKKTTENLRRICRYCCIMPVLALMTILSLTIKAENTMAQQNFYCEYCGHKFANVRLLTSGTCPRHPSGSNKGKHKLYEGTEKSKYTCKFCGRQFPSIMLMTGGTCSAHPNGSNKGPHAPAL